MHGEKAAVKNIKRAKIGSSIFLVAVLFHASAEAQRGKNIPYRADEIGGANTASSGIPGVFDTELAREREFIAEFPLLSIDYGINERWTIGTNGVTTLFGLSALAQREFNQNSPSFYLKSRHAVFADSGWKGTLTGYFLAFNNLVPTGAQKTLKRSRILASSLNISKQAGRQLFGLSSFGVHQIGNRGDRGSIEQEHERTVAFIFTPLWKFKISDNFDSITTATLCPYARSISSNAVARKDSFSGCLGENKLSTVWRALINWRSSESWLWTIGAISIPGTPAQIFPYIGFNTLWSPQDHTAEDEE
ncbi:MAG: hypothetical protein RI932_1342 [Pseudomonadota bacterium]|jgi:hypothetical protein